MESVSGTYGGPSDVLEGTAGSGNESEKKVVGSASGSGLFSRPRGGQEELAELGEARTGGGVDGIARRRSSAAGRHDRDEIAGVEGGGNKRR